MTEPLKPTWAETFEEALRQRGYAIVPLDAQPAPNPYYDHPDAPPWLREDDAQPAPALAEALEEARGRMTPGGFVTVHGIIGDGANAARGFAVEAYSAGAIRQFHRWVPEAALAKPEPAGLTLGEYDPERLAAAAAHVYAPEAEAAREAWMEEPMPEPTDN